jgi:hypothetical protein
MSVLWACPTDRWAGAEHAGWSVCLCIVMWQGSLAWPLCCAADIENNLSVCRHQGCAWFCHCCSHLLLPPPCRLRRNEELLQKLRGASDVPQLRTVLRQLLASGWLVETSQTLRAALGQAPAVALAAFVAADAAAEAAARAAAPAATAAAAAAEVTVAESEAVPPPSPLRSPAASGASDAAACQPPLSDELPPLALQADMAATLPAGGQQRMEGWQQQLEQQEV